VGRGAESAGGSNGAGLRHSGGGAGAACCGCTLRSSASFAARICSSKTQPQMQLAGYNWQA